MDIRFAGRYAYVKKSIDEHRFWVRPYFPYRIHRLHLSRGVGHPQHTHTNKCSGYDTKQSDGEVPLMQEFWEMQSTLSWPSLPGALCSRMVAPDRALSMGQIELNFELILNWIWNEFWNGTVFDTESVLTLNWIV